MRDNGGMRIRAAAAVLLLALAAGCYAGEAEDRAEVLSVDETVVVP